MWLMEEGNVHLLGTPPSLPKESEPIHRYSWSPLPFAAFAQHPTVQGRVPGAKQPLAVLSALVE